MARLFSTPIACGLVTGALAGGLTVYWQWVSTTSYGESIGTAVFLDLGCNLLLCSGALLSRRKAALIGWTFFWTAAATSADMVLVIFPGLGAMISYDAMFSFFFSSAAAGALIGLGLHKMYESRTPLLRAVLLGMLGELMLMGMIYAQERTMANDMHRAMLWLMPILLAHVATATLPVIAIDRERRASPELSFTSPPATSKSLP